ncbi:biotin-dependent carboxyltransferase family protein [Polaromonas sp. P2-4]|nr:biotin-dependent carboxyltransferase family protein [Polaromonas sp. P2-4]
MIEVLSSAALSTIQDLGRTGSLRWGVGTAGAMDPLALAAGNLLLGNEVNAAGVEVPVFPFVARFVEDCAFALTGADCVARLDDTPLLPWWSYRARAGQVLTLNPPQQAGIWRASRAYLCLGGGVDVPDVLGSRSTQLRGAFGGHDGRALRQGDVLRAAAPGTDTCPTGFGLVPPRWLCRCRWTGWPPCGCCPQLNICLIRKPRAAFWAGEWKITPQSDRYGYRLAGETLTPIQPTEMRSHGIVPGVIQVPSGGQPIIQMRDAQPSGATPNLAR